MIDRLIDAIPAPVVGICKRLDESGQRGWVVGGCVRDMLRGEPAKDWDIATDARPDQVQRMFRKVIPTGIQHGTVTVLIRGTPYEVTTLRGEGDYRDGRRPESVVFLDDIVEDLARRDFTFNAIAIDPLARQLIDPFDGAKDLQSLTVRAVGVARDRFCEDGLRILRAARFAAVLECQIEPATLAAMSEQACLDTYAKVSVERVHDEWVKALHARQPSLAFELMRDTGMLACSAPALLHERLDHALSTLDRVLTDDNTTVRRLAALLRHLDVGEASALLQHLKFSTRHRETTLHLLQQQDIDYEPEWSDGELRRWLRKIKPAHLADVMALATACRNENAAELIELEKRARAIIDAADPLEGRDLAVDGRVLMTELAIKPSRQVGELLAALLEWVLDDPSRNEAALLLERARSLLAENDVVANSQ